MNYRRRKVVKNKVFWGYFKGISVAKLRLVKVPLRKPNYAVSLDKLQFFAQQR